MWTIVLVGLYLVYALGGLYTVLFVTRVEKDWFEEIGWGMTLLCCLFIMAVWPPLLYLHVKDKKDTRWR